MPTHTEVPITEKFAATDRELVRLGFWSLSSLYRMRRDDPTFPRKIRGKTVVAEVREYFRRSQQAA